MPWCQATPPPPPFGRNREFSTCPRFDWPNGEKLTRGGPVVPSIVRRKKGWGKANVAVVRASGQLSVDPKNGGCGATAGAMERYSFSGYRSLTVDDFRQRVDSCKTRYYDSRK